MSFLWRIFDWIESKRLPKATEWTEENCGLTEEQIRLGRFTLNALGLQNRISDLTIDDLVFLCYSVGMNPPEYVIEAKLREIGLFNRNRFAFEHFLHLWRALDDHHNEESIILEKAFHFFDKDQDGEISTAEFKSAMKELGNLLSDAELDAFLETMDTNHDGSIDYGEFIRLLKCQRPVYMELANRSSLGFNLTPSMPPPLTKPNPFTLDETEEDTKS